MPKEWTEQDEDQRLTELGDEHTEYEERLVEAKHLDPVGYVQRHDDNTITFAVGGHTHHVSRQSAIQLARGIYDSLERY